jgi:hypothetical protein
MNTREGADRWGAEGDALSWHCLISVGLEKQQFGREKQARVIRHRLRGFGWRRSGSLEPGQENKRKP